MSQVSHAVWLELLCEPAAHTSQRGLVAVLMVLMGHISQLVRLTLGSVPARQWVQDRLLVALVTDPSSHGLQAPSPVSFL